jgi:hypothetical protein
MEGDGKRRPRRRHRAGRFARAIARRVAARVDRPGSAAARGIGTAAIEAVGTATWAAGRVGALYRVVADEASASARTRALRARNRVPLPSLLALHPEASALPVRSLGIQQVNVDEIAGTAVAGPDQRGSDFRPPPAFRSSNWQARWRRIRAAVANMESLPPVDLQKYAGRFWVVDGHNRIAAALYEGQVAVDAVVQELVPPGSPPPAERVSLAMEMAEGAAIRTAATGVPISQALRLDREAAAQGPDVRTVESEAEDAGTAPERSGAADGATATDRALAGTDPATELGP